MIYTPRACTTMMSRQNPQTCTKIDFRAYEISIAMDDSCGAMPDLARTEIRIFLAEQDVTQEFFPEGIAYSGENLYEIMQRIAEKVKSN